MKENRKTKKHSVIYVKYYLSKGGVGESSGIVIKQLNGILYLCHNFKGISPIDITRIETKNIIYIKEISIKEIKSKKDLY